MFLLSHPYLTIQIFFSFILLFHQFFNLVNFNKKHFLVFQVISYVFMIHQFLFLLKLLLFIIIIIIHLLNAFHYLPKNIYINILIIFIIINLIIYKVLSHNQNYMKLFMFYIQFIKMILYLQIQNLFIKLLLILLLNNLFYMD